MYTSYTSQALLNATLQDYPTTNYIQNNYVDNNTQTNTLLNYSTNSINENNLACNNFFLKYQSPISSHFRALPGEIKWKKWLYYLC